MIYELFMVPHFHLDGIRYPTLIPIAYGREDTHTLILGMAFIMDNEKLVDRLGSVHLRSWILDETRQNFDNSWCVI
jgi:hypothetical protein